MTEIVIPKGVQSPLAERLLEDEGLNYSLVLLPMSLIDVEASLSNQVRTDPILPDRVEAYMASRRYGADFPGCLVGRPAKGLHLNALYIIADGNQRYTALLKLLEERFWAYLFDFNDWAQFEAIARSANQILNGQPNAEEDRILHAVTYVERGVSIEEAAVMFQLKKAQIHNRIAANRTRDRLLALGISSKIWSMQNDRALAKVSVATDEVLRDVLLALRDGARIDTLTKDLLDASRVARTHTETVDLQKRALAAEVDARTKIDVSSLVKPRRTRKETRKMRLIGSVTVIKEVLTEPDPEFDPILQEIRDLVCP